jgi:putative membrane protein
MLLDWALASLRHLAIFTLAAIIAFELALTARAVDDTAIARLARIDAWYGVVAGVVLAVGAARVMFGAKGPAYYVANAFFWTKMGLFVAAGLLSILPTLRYLAWRRQLRAEVVPFAGIPVAAAAMARGYGM